MNIKKQLLTAAALSSLAMSSSVFAATGGGATIHNAASLTFSGGQVTDSVDVAVLTIGSIPTFAATDEDVNSGDTISVTYTITSNSNGADTYDLVVSTTDTDVSAPSALSIVPASIELGASITSRSSTPGTIYIAAGSETHISGGDVVRLNLGGTDYFYTVSSVTAGTPAFTVANTTTPEVATAIVLAPLGASPAILLGNVPIGTQVGERDSFVVSLTAGTPTTPGDSGSHEIVIDGTAGEPGPGGPGDVIAFTSDPGTSTITVLSGDATLVKEVRNVTEGTAFATSGITARTGDVLEYRLTAGTIPGETITGAALSDSIPEHATYVPNSTFLNGAPVADVGPDSALAAGMAINSASGAAGEIVDGETAVVLFQVTVD